MFGNLFQVRELGRCTVWPRLRNIPIGCFHRRHMHKVQSNETNNDCK